MAFKGWGFRSHRNSIGTDGVLVVMSRGACLNVADAVVKSWLLKGQQAACGCRQRRGMSGGGKAWDATRDRGKVETSRKRMVHVHDVGSGSHGDLECPKYCPSQRRCCASSMPMAQKRLRPEYASAGRLKWYSRALVTMISGCQLIGGSSGRIDLRQSQRSAVVRSTSVWVSSGGTGFPTTWLFSASLIVDGCLSDVCTVRI